LKRSPLRRVVLATFAVLALAPAVASAEESERNAYLVFKAGPYFPTASNAVDAIGGITFTWPTSYTIEGGVGAYWGLFGLQLSAGYITTGEGQADVHAVPILVLARLRLPLGFIAPYVEGGAGVSIATSTFSNLAQGASVSSTEAAFEAVGGAGVDFYFGPLLVGAELKYIWLDPSFDFSGVNNVQGFTQKLNMSGITVVAYVGYRF
jgi:hypothetical protein